MYYMALYPRRYNSLLKCIILQTSLPLSFSEAQHKSDSELDEFITRLSAAFSRIHACSKNDDSVFLAH
jgi:hypothetical protein